MRHALYLPPFGELADVRALAEIAATAEAAGWDGLFVWDHLLRAEPGAEDVADTTVALAAVALATERALRSDGHPICGGDRRSWREIITLDHLSGGRLVGFGLGVDTARELSAFGEVTDARIRAQMLDEGAAVLDALVAAVRSTTSDRTTSPRGSRSSRGPVQRPRPPFWFAGGGGTPPVARRLATTACSPSSSPPTSSPTTSTSSRDPGSLDGFDVEVTAHGNDLAAFAAAGVTWAMWDYPPGVALAEVLADARRGPRV
ncbi:MAG: LLM class flavin-dependent oxidoreductase [Acidimicrobiales bacterium]